jgi:hypothetical protein
VSDRLPRWDARNEGEQQMMRRWANERVEEVLCAMLEAWPKVEEKFQARMADGGLEIEMARCGDVEPLRRRYPDLADFIHLPPPQRGRPLNPRRATPQWIAAVYTVIIRDLWKKHYGKRNRTQAPTAEEIAADRWGVEVDQVLAVLKKIAADPAATRMIARARASIFPQK